jgi:enoyl-CoA hydratase/carnithine racemase
MHIRVSDIRRVRWIEFDRAPVNAFNRQMVEETRDAIGAAVADPDVRVIVLASAVDRYFSAGADLNEFDGMKSPGMRQWVGMCHEIALRLYTSPKPLLAAIHGTAVGGGLEMTLHCDLRFAASNARFGQPEVAIGFIPPIATTQTLVRLIGRPRTLQYLYEGGMIDADTALGWGLVDHLVSPDGLRDQVQAYADGLTAKSATALAAIRSCVTQGGGMSFENGMALEADVAASLADTDDFAEGISAFLAKRQPKWSGD